MRQSQLLLSKAESSNSGLDITIQEQHTLLPSWASLPLLNLSEVSEKQLAPLLLIRLPWILKSMLMQGGDGNAELVCQDKAQGTDAEPD